MTTRTFIMSNMTCNSSIVHIEELEDTLPGVKKIEVNFKNYKTVAEFDEIKRTSQVIAGNVVKLGYPAVQSEDVPKKGLFSWKR